MAYGTDSSTVTRIDYGSTFGFTRIFNSFRIAVQPGKLVLGLLIVLTMLLVGWVMDGLFGGRVVQPGEFEAYVAASSEEQFEQRLENIQQTTMRSLAGIIEEARPTREVMQEVSDTLRDAEDPHALAIEAIGKTYQQKRDEFAEMYGNDPEGLEDRLVLITEAEAGAIAQIDALQPRGVFQTVQRIISNSFSNLVGATGATLVTIDPEHIGFDQFNPAQPLNERTIIGSLRTVVYELPGWLWAQHPWYLAIWLIVFVVIWSLLGGAISRMAMIEATLGEQESVAEAVAFSSARWFTYATTPLLPLIFAGLFGLLLAVLGLLFYVPGLDILAALLWVIAIALGFAMAFLLIVWLGAVHLIYPAIAAEGTDGFDAVSRGFSYVLHRPWRFVTYTLLAIGYGAITYLFVGTFIFLTLYLAQQATAAWSPFEQLYPEPRLGHLHYEVDTTELGWTQRVGAVLIWVWTTIFISLVAAYAISYYFSVYSQIYLLLRRRHDGTGEGQVYIDPLAERRRAADALPLSDKVEPVPASDAAQETDLDRKADEQ